MIKYLMQKTINTDKLKIGMHVLLPASWFKHPFLRNQFTISSQDEIDKIRASGFDEVIIDLDKGFSDEEEMSSPALIEDTAITKTWNSESLIPSELREAIHDKRMKPEKKAKVVYHSSREIMERLLEAPSAQNIKEVKKGVAEIVDLIISDSETSQNLLKITSHDFYTYTHSVNVGVYSVMIAKAYFGRSDAHDMHELGASFFLHDIGKVRVAPEIINKPGKLTPEEFETMKMHAQHGYDILAETDNLTEEGRIIVMQHHERGPGSGYPKKLKAEEIHVYGRICSMADVYDAITAERSYKAKQTTFEALKIMKDQLLDHFGMDLYEKLVMIFGSQ